MGEDKKQIWKVDIALVATASEANDVFREVGQLLASLIDHSGGQPIPWAAQLDDDKSLFTREGTMLLAMLRQAKGDIPPGLLPSG